MLPPICFGLSGKLEPNTRRSTYSKMKLRAYIQRYVWLKLLGQRRRNTFIPSVMGDEWTFSPDLRHPESACERDFHSLSFFSPRLFPPTFSPLGQNGLSSPNPSLCCAVLVALPLLHFSHSLVLLPRLCCLKQLFQTENEVKQSEEWSIFDP